MSVDDRIRNDPYRKLESVLGTEEANTLMVHLPPTTSRDLATSSWSIAGQLLAGRRNVVVVGKVVDVWFVDDVQLIT